jgi:hypothetical protein
MMVQQKVAEWKPSGRGRAIVRAWLVAGTMDITAATVYYPWVYKFKAILLFQNIASGVFGESAFRGGIMLAALGLVFHYFIALTWTVLFFVVYPKIKLLSKSRMLSGVAYGIFVWAAMNLVVLPLSRVQQAPFSPDSAIIAALFLVFCIGIPNAILAHRYYHG